MPEAAQKIYRQIGLSDDVSKTNPENLSYGELKAGTRIGETEAVFPRIDKQKVMSEIQKDAEQTQRRGGVAQAFEEKKERSEEERKTASNEKQMTTDDGQHTTDDEQFIGIEDFLKVELRVGEIKVAERIPKADKLLRFEIDLGEDQPRQILAGLAEYYEPEKLIGRKVVVVANLKPRKMRGLESQGMICAASLENNSDDAPAIATFLEDVKIGARLK
jgi:methionyl-tRNA synthetase